MLALLGLACLMPSRGNFKSIFVGNILHKLPYPVIDGEPSYLRMSAFNSTQRRFLYFLSGNLLVIRDDIKVEDMAISIGQQSKMITKILRVNIKVPNWLQWWSLWKKELRKRQWAQNNGCQGSLHKWKGVGCRWVLCIGNIPSASIKDNYVDPSYNHATFGGKCDSRIVTFMSSKQEKKGIFYGSTWRNCSD